MYHFFGRKTRAPRRYPAGAGSRTAAFRQARKKRIQAKRARCIALMQSLASGVLPAEAAADSGAREQEIKAEIAPLAAAEPPRASPCKISRDGRDGWKASRRRTSKPCGCWQSTWTGSAQGGQEKGKGKWLRGYAAERPALPTGPPAPAEQAESACSALKGGAVRPGGGVPGRAMPSQESDALDLPGRLGLWIFAASHREDARGGLPISPLRLPTPRPPLQGLFAPAPRPRGVPPRPDPPARGKAGGKTCGSAREDAGEIPPRKRPPGKENMGRLTRFRKKRGRRACNRRQRMV